MIINLKQTKTYFSLAVTALFLYSCGDSGKKNAASEKAAAFDKAETKVIDEIDKVVHELPPPSEVPYMLQATGADFNPALPNSLENAGKYQNSMDKSALNLGGYATDIGYLTSNDKTQEALKYMEVCQKLADKVGISSAFDLDMMERFEKNLGNKDSLSNLINIAITMAEDKLEDSDKLNMVAMILSGSYIEGLYLSVMVIDTYPEDLLTEESRNLILEPLMRVIIEQEKSLIDIIALLKDIEQDEIIANIIAEFSILRILYDDDVAAISEKISGNDSKFVLKKEMLVDVISEVKRIRADMIK
ncbi:hypothetical protein [Reichenbachiella sp. MALMAid0571]|uniref:hypothetical protein n=1 Tax=Reichenbachiella sp. MALMAid0571 TaxID=3143939 RepID=UPI0032DE8B43